MPLFFILTVIKPQKVRALSGSDFQAGKIIDDSVFYNGNAMSAGEIQNFLNAKVPTCDTNGTQMRGSVTRAVYGASVGNPPPYICLKNYTENTPTKSADSYCSGTYNGGSKSAAQIIRDVGAACGVSQKSLIVLLQKEQSLITDDWPWNIQYRSATGYGCPDTAACDSTYYGFFNQVYNAARQFKRYSIQPQLFNYRGGQTSYIQYNPNAGCGGTNVYIHNAATAALYNYTPYQPNASALNNLYGSGDSCGAYGNRNFWRMHNDWFGLDPNGMIMNGVSMTTIAAPYSTPARGQTISYTVQFTNNLSVNLTFDAVGIVGRYGNVTTGSNRDYGWTGPITLNAGASQQFTFTTTVKDIGNIYVWPAIMYQGGFVQYNNWGNTLNSHAPNFTLAQQLSSNPSSIYAGQDVTFSTVLKNNEPYPINYDAIGIPVKYYDRYNYDAVWVGPGVIASGAELTLNGVRNIDKPGPFSYWVSNYYSGEYSTVGPVNRFNASEVSPNFSVSGLSFSTTSPVQGGSLEASFTVKNNLPVPITVGAVGVVGRYGALNGLNRDIGWQGPVTFSAGETKSFTGYTRTITDIGSHYYWIGILNNGGFIQYNNWGSTIVSRAP